MCLVSLLDLVRYVQTQKGNDRISKLRMMHFRGYNRVPVKVGLVRDTPLPE